MAVDLILLRKLPLFMDFSEDQLTKIAELCSEKQVIAGQTFFQEGESGEAIFVIPHGDINILFTASGDTLASIQWVTAGDVLGFHSLVPPFKYLSTATSLNEGTLLVVEIHKILELFNQDSQIGISLITSMIHSVLTRITCFGSLI